MTTSTPDAESATDGSRRRFLTIFAGAAVLGVVPLATSIASRRQVPAQGASASDTVAGIPGLAAFSSQVGSTFESAATESQPALSLTLAEAEAIENKGKFAGEQFSLRFDTPPGHAVEGRIYQLRHPVLGSIELFISPVGRSDRPGGQQMGEAIVTSLVRAA